MRAAQVTRARILLVGAGNVGRRFLELLVLKRAGIRALRGLDLVPVGVADSTGTAVCPAGLDAGALVELKRNGRGVAEHQAWGRLGSSAREMLESVEADIFLEASPANLRDGQPALGWIEAALSRRMHVVLANKAPLAHAYRRLRELARANGVELRFDATVAGGLPVVNLGERDLAGTKILRLEGLVNLTANYILSRMASGGIGYEEALAEAQAAGHAETDPSLDVDGWDAAVKLVILANCLLDQPATLGDVAVEGIRGVTPGMLRQAAAMGQRIKLLALAEPGESGYRLSVRPAWLPASHPMAQLGAEQMGILFNTDVCGVLSASIVEDTPMPTAFAMLRDVLETFRHTGASG